MHSWGDEWFEKNGDDLYKAQVEIINYVKRYGFCHLMSKEKYGTIRYEYIFPPGGGLFYRHWYSRIWIGSMPYRRWQQYGWYLTKRGVLKTIEKYPHLRSELLSDLASNYELMGKDIHDEFWRS